MKLWIVGICALAVVPMRAQQPADISFQISLAKSTFYVGEIIPLQLSFSSTSPGKYTCETLLQDRSYRLDWYERFVAEPHQLTNDPLANFNNGGMGALGGGPTPLSDKPFTFERVLNEWIHFQQPGVYKVHVESQGRVNVGPESGHDAGLLTSNEVTLEVRPAPEGWAAGQFAAAVKVLDRPYKALSATWDARNRAALTLRFLKTPEAAAELKRRSETARADPANMPPEARQLYLGSLGY